MSITRILVPTDFSNAAARALEYGSRLRRAPCPVLAIPACAGESHAPEVDARLTLLQALTCDSARLAS